MSLSATGVTWLDAWLGFAPASEDNRLVITGDWTLYNKETELEEHLYSSIARPYYSTGASDTPASKPFLPRLLFPDFSMQIAQVGESSRRSTATIGNVGLVNPDGKYDDYLNREKYEWRSCEYRIGIPDTAYTSFESVQTVRFDGPPSFDGGLILLTPLPALLDTKQPGYDAYYQGYDTAYKTDGTSYIESKNTDLCIAAAEDAYWRIRFKIPASTDNDMIWASRAAIGASAGFSLYVDTTGDVQFRIGDGATEVIISHSTTADDNAWHDIQVWLDRSDDTLNGRYDSVAFSTDAADASSLGAVVTTLKDRLFEETDGGAPCRSNAEIDEKYLATGQGIAPTATQLKQDLEGPISVRRAGTQYYWPLDEDGDETTVLTKNFFDAHLQEVVEQPKNHAIEGTATNRYVDYGNSDHDMDASTSYTVWAWFRPDAAIGTYETIVGKKAEISLVAGWILYLDTNAKLGVQIADGSTAGQIIYSAGIALTDEVWRCAAFVVNRTTNTLHLYISDSSGTVWTEVGTGVSISSIGSLSNAVKCFQGGANDGTTYPLDGDVSSWGFAAKAMNTDELARFCPIHPLKADIPELEHYYAYDQADEDAGTVYDKIGSADGIPGAGANWVNRDGTIDSGTSGTFVASLTGSFWQNGNLHGGGGRSKQQGYGFCEQSPVVWIDNRGHDYTSVHADLTDAIVGQFHSGPDACEAVTLVTEGELDMEPMSGGVGDYVIDLTNGLIYLDVSGGLPVKTVNVYFKGAKFNGGVYSDRLGLILREILTTNGHLTTTEIPATSASDLDSQINWPVSVLIPGGQERAKSIGEVLDDALAPHMHWTTDLEGEKFLFGVSLIDPDAYATAADFTDKEIRYETLAFGVQRRPIRSVRVGFGRQWGAITDGDFLGAVPRAARQRVGAEWRYAVASSATVQAEDGDELVLNSPFQRRADAQALAEQILGLMEGSAPITFEIARHWWQVTLGDEGQPRADVVSVQSDHFPEISTAKNYMVKEIQYTPPGPESTPSIRIGAWRSA